MFSESEFMFPESELMFSESARRRGPREDSEIYSGKDRVARGKEKYSMAGRSLRSRVIPEPEVPPPPTRTTAVRGRAGSRGRGRGRGRVGRAATEVGARVQPRARGGRRAHSERPPVIPEPSQQESSTSHPAPFVTKEDFQTEMGKLQATL
ncbi:hypothetical protein OSB04_029054 [Centaurea solstitialis]|uniref:Uncharacterized protein n=1 Tax=Centaurea solstitialis TaxID=347529 RepID=A0AA38SHQ0_9ASTR|nr:hypothetical protein OSB04_029054 [Centaurea solstitialis]